MGAIEEYKARRAAQEARQAKQQEPPQKIPWWFKEPLPIDRFTGWLMAYTGLLFFATIGSAIVLLKTDYTLHEQVEATRQQLALMQADQRPWVDGSITISGDLSIYEKDALFITAGVMLPLQAKLRNTGRTPALYTDFGAKIVTFHIPKGAVPDKESGGGIERFVPGIGSSCMTRERSKIAGQVLFPGDTDVVAEAFAFIDKEGLDAARAMAAPGRDIFAVVIACIRYESGNRNPHRTMKVYYLAKTTGSCFLCAFEATDKRVLARNLMLSPLGTRERVWDVAD